MKDFISPCTPHDFPSTQQKPQASFCRCTISSVSAEVLRRPGVATKAESDFAFTRCSRYNAQAYEMLQRQKILLVRKESHSMKVVKPILTVVVLGLLVATFSLAHAQTLDPDVTFWVKDALRNDPRLDLASLTVVTENGFVRLTGTVRTLAATRYAVREAQKIRGVKGVIDELLVVPRWRSDETLQQEVRRRILNSAVIESQKIQVEVTKGTVTLTGKVATWSEAQEAALLASEVEGVKEIHNNVGLENPITRSDQDIKTDSVAALQRNVYFTNLPITVTVHDGVVSLEGTVGSAYEKTKATKLIQRISHVKDVRNHLKVNWLTNHAVRESMPKMSDENLETSIRTELKQDERVNPSGVAVVVAGGNVRLDGSVFTLRQKEYIEQDVRNVVGVAWVTNNLHVGASPIEDWPLANNVEYELTRDVALKGEELHVRARKGIVTLTGQVHSWWEYFHAGKLASGVAGTTQVINGIKVDADSKYSDASLRQAIHKRLTWNWTTHWVHAEIHVAVRNGVATLSGTVDTWAQRKEAGSVAYHTDGIWLVDDRLVVSGFDMYAWEEWYYNGDYQTKPPSEYYAVFWGGDEA